jgi:hypothetical protein
VKFTDVKGDPFVAWDCLAWTGATMGVFAMRDGATEERNADFDYFRVGDSSGNYVIPDTSVTPSIPPEIIIIPKNGPQEITVFDMNGRIVPQCRKVNGNRSSGIFPDLAAGVYKARLGRMGCNRYQKLAVR